MKKPRKYSAISIYDYPKDVYSAYWEYVVNEDLTYQVALYDYDGKLLSTFGGGPYGSEEEARQKAQESIAMKMEQYRKDVKPLSDEEVDLLVKQFDEARLAAAAGDRAKFGTVDTLRGLLKAHGIVLAEWESIGYEAKTEWVRG